MKIKQITIFRSRTVGSLDHSGKTRFKKIQFEAVVDITDENEAESKADYDKASGYVDHCLTQEAKK